MPKACTIGRSLKDGTECSFSIALCPFKCSLAAWYTRGHLGVVVFLRHVM